MADSSVETHGVDTHSAGGRKPVADGSVETHGVNTRSADVLKPVADCSVETHGVDTRSADVPRPVADDSQDGLNGKPMALPMLMRLALLSIGKALG